ncbi:MAG TPA: hypothetical protein PLL26_04695 [Candidatus Dojkabacteria bacterium]|nr:hypothetical protein [Candidatus Dojkabacteria bacterium]
MDVDLSKLPISIQRQIPLSLRSYKNVHVLEELPVTVQYIIRKYLEKTLSVVYDVSFDIRPDISKYSDFVSYDNLTDLLVEYLKNYLLILPESYPWDPYFGSRLKYQVQTRDLNLRQTIITSEINNIVRVISLEVGIDVTVESVEIVPTSTGSSTEYNATILLKINNDQRKKINMSFS